MTIAFLYVGTRIHRSGLQCNILEHQNKIAVLVGCSLSTISKLTRQMCSRRFSCSYKPKRTARNERQLNRILICSRFSNCGDISQVCNDASVAVSLSATHRRHHQLRYDSRILFTNPSARAGYDTRSIFKRSLTGLNSEFSFS